MVKNIVFDIGRVLVDYDWESYLDSFGFSPEVRARVAAAVFQNKDWGELDRGAIPEEEVLARFIAKAPEVETEIRKVWGHVFETIHERPYPPRWIQTLKKRGFGVYYLSNYSDVYKRQVRHPARGTSAPSADGQRRTATIWNSVTAPNATAITSTARIICSHTSI